MPYMCMIMLVSKLVHIEIKSLGMHNVVFQQDHIPSKS